VILLVAAATIRIPDISAVAPASKSCPSIIKFLEQKILMDNFGAALGAGVRAIRFVPPPPPSSVGSGVTSVLYNY
jgi:hypothetical protein